MQNSCFNILLFKNNLAMKQTYHLRNQKGFTLIEVLYVMIIIGVMGAVAIKNVDCMTDTADAQAL
jgi:prepilin-type N-terminal cleavage/methylation domain-containing protein